MKPVFQTQFGEDGNCLAACIASLLEIPIERVPLIANKKHGDWNATLQSILYGMGFYYMEIDLTKPVALCKIPDAYCILTMRTECGSNHAVVAMTDFTNHTGFKLRHDPHREELKLIGPPIAVGFLVPLNPAASVEMRDILTKLCIPANERANR